MKACTKCGVAKPLSYFYLIRGRHATVCKRCNIERLQTSYKADPSKHRIGQLRREFGLSPEKYEDMLCAQDGKCSICRLCFSQQKRAPHVDHDHATGKVRALLCHGCNTALGGIKDSITSLARAIEYLEFHRAS